MSARACGIVTLLTDFGDSDWYLGAMRGVILSRCPECRLVDITHEIPRGNIYAGAYVLKEAFPYFPPGTVHLAVVDPGVGGARRPLLVKAGKHWFVGPDNGIFSLLLQEAGGVVVWHLKNKGHFMRPLSSTFHGRDLFAPVAAYVASGGNPKALGPETRDWVELEVHRPRSGQGEMVGRIAYVDRFGNGITNIRAEDLIECLGRKELVVQVGDHVVGDLCHAYVNVPLGQALALIGSSGFIEISVHGGSAKAALGLEAGLTSVSVRPRRSG